MPAIGQLLREARAKAGLTQSEASEATGISQGNISEYESGKIEPGLVILAKLCATYKTTVSKLTKKLEV